MKKFITQFFLSSFLICICSVAAADDYVVCSKDSSIPIYKFDLKTVLFKAKEFEPVAKFQSFGLGTTVIRYKEFSNFPSSLDIPYFNSFNSPSTIRLISFYGKNTNYIRVQFIERDDKNNVGWVDENLIKSKADCKKSGILLSDYIINSNDPLGELFYNQDVKPKDPIKPISGLDDKNCCVFPLKRSPKESYTDGIKKFGSSRDKGSRTHAASDLYQSQYHPIYAVADGEVLVDRAPFYLGTSATEIRHTGGFIVRYGEIASSYQKPLKLGKTVKAGQLIGYIKKVNSRSVYSAMLHFELYSGKGKGSLTTSSGKYQRRSDLLNPTPYLVKWEAKLK